MKSAALIPLTHATVTANEIEYVSRALHGQGASGMSFTRQAENLLTGYTGSAGAMLTTSCTHALEMAALLLDVGPEDEIIVPAFTFVSTANAFALRGARIVFADIRPDTLNLDVDHVARLLSPRTKAVVPVHYGGVGCDMQRLMALCDRAGVRIVEDNAHGVFGTYAGKPLGSFGCLAALSFHSTKNFSCGEGGALLVNDPSLISRAEIIRDKGTNRSVFLRGEVDKYTWVGLGSSYVIADSLAAILLSQLESRDQIQGARKRAWDFYMKHLAPWADGLGISLPKVPEECGIPYHLFYLLLPDPAQRTQFITHMKQAGITCSFHYVPLNKTPFGMRYAGTAGYPVTEDISARLVRLPLSAELSQDDLERIVQVATRFGVNAAAPKYGFS